MLSKYKVKLSIAQREELTKLIRNGKEKAKKLTHARILLQADCNKSGSGLHSKKIAENLGIHEKTVRRVRERFSQEGLEVALNRRPHRSYKPRKLDGEQEAHLIALCCSHAPSGHSRWTLELLSDELVRLKLIDSISRSTIHRTLKKTNLSLG